MLCSMIACSPWSDCQFPNCIQYRTLFLSQSKSNLSGLTTVKCQPCFGGSYVGFLRDFSLSHILEDFLTEVFVWSILLARYPYIHLSSKILCFAGGSLMMYNVTGMFVTDSIGAVARTVLESLRTLFVWLVRLPYKYWSIVCPIVWLLSMRQTFQWLSMSVHSTLNGLISSNLWASLLYTF